MSALAANAKSKLISTPTLRRMKIPPIMVEKNVTETKKKPCDTCNVDAIPTLRSTIDAKTVLEARLLSRLETKNAIGPKD
jgi:hypothetical protein